MSTPVLERKPDRQILVLKGKYGDLYYDASTPKLREAAYVQIFHKHLKDGYYAGIPQEGRFLRALNGNVDAICTFVRSRVDHEYEDIEEDVLFAFEVKNTETDDG